MDTGPELKVRKILHKLAEHIADVSNMFRFDTNLLLEL